MATITKKSKAPAHVGSTPWGNAQKLQYTLETNSSGAALNSDSTSAIASGDKVRVGLIPAGTRLWDSQSLIGTGMTASVTGKLGFEYVDGVDVTAVPQDDDYFGSGLALNAAARLRNTTQNPPVTLPKDAWLILTTGGADNAKASRIDFLLDTTFEGVA